MGLAHRDLDDRINFVPSEVASENKQYFRHRFENMDVNGGSTPQTFDLDAVSDYDIVITKAVLWVIDSDIKWNRFGNINASNGFDLFHRYDGDDYYIIDGAIDLKEIIVSGCPTYGFGDQSSAMRWEKLDGDNDGFIHCFDFSAVMAGGGVILRKGTSDLLRAQVNDNFDGLSEFGIDLQGWTV